MQKLQRLKNLFVPQVSKIIILILIHSTFCQNELQTLFEDICYGISNLDWAMTGGSQIFYG